MRLLRLYIAISLSAVFLWNETVQALPLGVAFSPSQYSPLFQDQALMQAIGLMRTPLKTLIAIRERRMMAVHYEKGIFSAFQDVRAEHLAQLKAQGLTLRGSRWLSDDDLEELNLIQQALPRSGNHPRALWIIPWFAVPLAVLTQLPLVPWRDTRTLVALPNRTAFRLLAAMEGSFYYLDQHPDRVKFLGPSKVDDAITLAAHTLNTVAFPAYEAGMPRSTRLAFTISMFAWIVGSVLSGWDPIIVKAPVIPALIIAGLTFWAVGLIRPLTLYKLHYGQEQWQRTRAVVSTFLYRLPLIIAMVLFLQQTFIYTPGDGDIHIHWPVPFAPLDKMIRAFKEGRDQKETTDQVRTAQPEARVTPLIFAPHRLPPVPASADQPLPVAKNRPIQPIDQGPISQKESPLPQIETSTERPVPPTGNPEGVYKLVALFGFEYHGNNADLKEAISKDANIAPENRQQILEELERRLHGDVTQQWRLSIEQKSDNGPYIITKLQPLTEKEIPAPEKPQNQSMDFWDTFMAAGMVLHPKLFKRRAFLGMHGIRAIQEKDRMVFIRGDVLLFSVLTAAVAATGLWQSANGLLFTVAALIVSGANGLWDRRMVREKFEASA